MKRRLRRLILCPDVVRQLATSELVAVSGGRPLDSGAAVCPAARMAKI
jgi:hypothetical protein